MPMQESSGDCSEQALLRTLAAGAWHLSSGPPAGSVRRAGPAAWPRSRPGAPKPPRCSRWSHPPAAGCSRCSAGGDERKGGSRQRPQVPRPAVLIFHRLPCSPSTNRDYNRQTHLVCIGFLQDLNELPNVLKPAGKETQTQSGESCMQPLSRPGPASGRSRAGPEGRACSSLVWHGPGNMPRVHCGATHWCKAASGWASWYAQRALLCEEKCPRLERGPTCSCSPGRRGWCRWAAAPGSTCRPPRCTKQRWGPGCETAATRRRHRDLASSTCGAP